MAGSMPVAYEWLMPLAPWESSERLLMALESLYQQTWPARRLVVSVDGQLSGELAEVLQRAPIPVLVLQSPTWQGTGPALAAGLSACQCEWVLRADADDQSVPERAERQLSYLREFPHLSVLGGQLSETSDPQTKPFLRCVPLSLKKIQRMMSWRNPINHPTVALNRKRVLFAGNYRATLGFEDWDLWLRLSHKGEVLANLPDVLVDAAVDQAHLCRRHGLAYAKLEFLFFLRCYRDKLLPAWKVVLLICLRLPWRVLPKIGLASVMASLRSSKKMNLICKT